MGRRKKVTSVRGRQETNKLFSDAYEGTKKALASINKLLDEGKPLSDEEFRFLKKCPSLIQMYANMEEGKETEEVLPEGQLKEWVDKHVIMQNKIIDATGNKRFKLTKEAMNDIADRLGYYRCGLCGNLHIKNRDCIIDEYVNLLQQSNNKTE